MSEFDKATVRAIFAAAAEKGYGHEARRILTDMGAEDMLPPVSVEVDVTVAGTVTVRTLPDGSVNAEEVGAAVARSLYNHELRPVFTQAASVEATQPIG